MNRGGEWDRWQCPGQVGVWQGVDVQVATGMQAWRAWATCRDLSGWAESQLCHLPLSFGALLCYCRLTPPNSTSRQVEGHVGLDT